MNPRVRLNDASASDRGYFRRVDGGWIGALWRRRQLLLDATVVVAIAAVTESLAWSGPGPGTQVAGPHWLSAPLGLLLSVPLLWRRTHPLLACSVVMGALGAHALVTRDSPEGLEIILALGVSAYSVSAYSPRRGALLGLIPLVLGYGAYTIGNQDYRSSRSADKWATAFFAMGTLAAWLIGLALHAFRTARASAAQTAARESQVAAAVAAERGRIARELHDVVSHNLSVVVVQAAGARAQQAPPDSAASATLAKIETSGREALVEMRRLLDVLRTEGEDATLAPQPGVADLTTLVDGVRRAGLPVTLNLAPDCADVRAVVGVAVFRIVQEALTNTLKHAGPAHATVSVRREGGDLIIEVLDDGRQAPSPSGNGYGLAGMRERVALLGGTVLAEPMAAGGFAVRACLPFIEPQP
jgi:signal transduction histidine kinase